MIVRVGAVASIAVIGVNFAFSAIYRWAPARHLFLPIDVLLYLVIGFFAARALRSWSRGLAVVAIAAALDSVLSGASHVLPGAPQATPGRIVVSEIREFATNLAIGWIAALAGWKIR